MTHYLGPPPSVIEIHPGFRNNSYSDIATITKELTEQFEREFSLRPLILLENRTEQFISTGSDIMEYWEYIKENHPEIIGYSGIVLDVQQLFTKTGSNFIKNLLIVPDDCIKALHIHTDHRMPILGDKIPWRLVFNRFSSIKQDLIINPEIHQMKKVQETIKFCETFLT